SKGGGLARLAGRFLGVPTVYTPHSLIMSAPDLSPMERIVYTLIERLLGHWATSKIIAVSDEEREFILNLKLVPSGRVAVIENGIDDQDFDYLAEEPIRSIDGSNPLTFGSIMRFSPQKAPEHLIAAFIELHRSLPNLPMRLLIAGHGELFAEAQKQVAESGLQENISLLGWRTDTKEVLHDFDIFVLPSLYEGFSYAILEAMAARLPIVSTNVFGTRGTILRVPGNVVVPVGDPAALADGMQQMATLTAMDSLRPALRKIGDANQDYVRAHFRNSDTTRRIVELYQALR
ncbi:MAG: glycosyltransferase, partial [Actinomycetota bacterium]|nr:glycosyltransferase [Actinomycetota bacterium]